MLLMYLYLSCKYLILFDRRRFYADSAVGPILVRHHERTLLVV